MLAGHVYNRSMLTALVALLTTQAGTVTVRPPTMLDMLPFTVRPVGVWKVSPVKNPGAAMFVAGPKAMLTFSGNKTTHPQARLDPDVVYRINGLTWHTNVRVNMFKVTVFSAIADLPGKEFTASGQMTGGLKGKMAADALATLKTFRPL